MSKLLDQQNKFAAMVSLLIPVAQAMGYQISFGDAFRDPRCHYGSENSFHRKRLAIDLNLFKDGEYLTKTEDHKPLGEFWERLGGTWGGRWQDGNHYSLGEGGE